MMWEPKTCKLPYRSAEGDMKKPGRVVFVGDSVSDTSATSFAWFYDQSSQKRSHKCSIEKEDMFVKIQPQLQKAGFEKKTVEHTMQFLQSSSFRKGHMWW